MTVKELKDLQKEANRYMKYARNELKTAENGYLERAFVNANNRMRMFQVKHNQRKGYMFSMKGLEEGDYEVYENLLKSVTENKRLNPELSEKHRQSQIDFYIDKGWAKDRQSAEALFDFKGTTIFEELMENNLSDIPSEILERLGKFIDADYSVEDFGDMISVFTKDLGKQENSYNGFEDFVRYTDVYIESLNEREDFRKAVTEYLNDESDYYNTFFDFLEEF